MMSGAPFVARTMRACASGTTLRKLLTRYPERRLLVIHDRWLSLQGFMASSIGPRIQEQDSISPGG
jgi:hypothetical protein